MFDRDQFRENLLIYTRKAFRMIPPLKEPSILDIGCGTGVPTIELAKLSKGIVTGVDKSRDSLDIFENKIKLAGLESRIVTIKSSLFKLNFPDESFDIIWSEGSMKFIGFTTGLKKWRKLLKPEGFHVVHEGLKNIDEQIGKIPGLGYKLISNFKISYEEWWDNYYSPMEKYIHEFDRTGPHDPGSDKTLEEAQREINMVRNNPEIAESWFIVMQKK